MRFEQLKVIFLAAFFAVNGQNFDGSQLGLQPDFFVRSNNPQLFQQPSFQQPQFEVQQPHFVLFEVSQPRQDLQQAIFQQQFQQPDFTQQAIFQQADFSLPQRPPPPPSPNQFPHQSQVLTEQQVQQTFNEGLMRHELPNIATQQKPSEWQRQIFTTQRPMPQTLLKTRQTGRQRAVRIRRPRPNLPPPPAKFLPPEPLRDVLQAISVFVRTKATPRPMRNVGITVITTTQIPLITTRRSSWRSTSASAAAITRKRVSPLVPHNANELFLQCCKEHGVDASCESRCNFDVLNKRVLTAMFLGSDSCPQSNGRDLLTCAAQEMDHTECCKARGVGLTSAGDKCLGFCQMSAGSQFQADVSMLPCWAVLRDIKQCFKDALIARNG